MIDRVWVKGHYRATKKKTVSRGTVTNGVAASKSPVPDTVTREIRYPFTLLNALTSPFPAGTVLKAAVAYRERWGFFPLVADKGGDQRMIGSGGAYATEAEALQAAEAFIQNLRHAYTKSSCDRL